MMDAGSRLTYSTDQRKPKEQNRTGLVVLGVALLFLIVVDALPVYFYYGDPFKGSSTSDDSRTRSHNGTENVDSKTQCQNGYDNVSESDLTHSVCSPFFAGWNASQAEIETGSPSYRNVFVSGCGVFATAEKELKEALVLGVSLWNPPQICLTKLKPLFCAYAFQDCNAPNTGPMITQKDCLTITNVLCSSLWKNLEKLRAKLGSGSRCLDLPKCNEFPHINSSEPSVEDVAILSTSPQCHPPLVPATNHAFGLDCSPPCDQSYWNTSVSKGYNIAKVFSIVFCWICLGVVFFTFTRVRTLFVFPSVTALFVSISFAIFFAAATIPFIVTPSRIYCSHLDLAGSWEDPSRICDIQGMIGQFGIQSSFMWWFFSVFNTLVTVWICSTDSIIVRRRKLFFFVEMGFSFTVPAILVAIARLKGGPYSSTSVFTIMCTPSSLSVMFYTYVLPVCTLVLVGNIMSALVVYRLYQAKKFQRRVCSQQLPPIYETYSLMQRRFLVLSFLMPLCFTVVMVTTMVYARLYMKFVRSFFDYIACVNSSTTNKDSCHIRADAVIACIVDLLIADAYCAAMTAYCLLPKDARKYWSKTSRKLRRSFQKLLISKSQPSQESTSSVSESTPLDLDLNFKEEKD
eukprot:m.15336 g.15336  ORF g.15336 m.15336 type:complete len:629 (+) comp26315_c0_seq1:112-1998(+)